MKYRWKWQISRFRHWVKLLSDIWCIIHNTFKVWHPVSCDIHARTTQYGLEQYNGHPRDIRSYRQCITDSCVVWVTELWLTAVTSCLVFQPCRLGSMSQAMTPVHQNMWGQKSREVWYPISDNTFCLISFSDSKICMIGQHIGKGNHAISLVTLKCVSCLSTSWSPCSLPEYEYISVYIRHLSCKS